jgi:hypothetical protein
MTVEPEFPVTQETWNAYLHGFHHNAGEAAARRRIVVNILLPAYRAALARWPGASEEDILRWVCLVLQNSINEQAAYLINLVENQPFPPIRVDG